MMRELRVRFVSGEESSVHTIYCKQHSVRHSSSLVPNGRTLFSLGWPPYCSREAIAELFSRAGQVIGVFLLDQPGLVEEESVTTSGRFHVAYIVFSDKEEVATALQLASSSTTLPCNVGPVGLAKWCAEYQAQFPDPATMETAVEEKIAVYDHQKEATKASLKKGLSEPDAEGWVTVTRKTPRVVKQ